MDVLRYCALLLFLVTFQTGLSQNIHSENITRSDGLLSDRIEDVTQDSSGFIWIVSTSGISRYSGTGFRHYHYEEMTNDIFPRSYAMRLYTDPAGGIWTSNQAGAVLSYDPVKDRFIIRNDSITRLPAIGISYFQDSTGNFWIGTLNGGLCYWDRRKNSVRTYRRSEHPDSLADNLITDINPGYEPGILTISTTRGNHLFSIAENKFYRRWYNSENPDDTYKHNVIRDFLETEDAYYAGTFGGFHMTRKSDFATRHFYDKDGNGQSLNYPSVWEMEEDEQGRIWIATYGGGINIFDPQTFSFTYLNRKNAGFREDNLRGIYKDRDGIFWVITDNTGLIKIDQRKSWIRHIMYSDIDVGGVMGVYTSSDSVIWIGANGGGLLRYDLHTGSVRRFAYDAEDPGSIAYDHVSSISADPDGNLWLGLAGGGLDYLDRDSGKFIHFPYDREKNSIPENAISEVLWTDSVVWYGTYSTGFGTYDPDSGLFTNYPFPNETYDIKTQVRALYEDSKGRVWILTDRGVSLYDNRRGELIDLINPAKPEMPFREFSFNDIAEYSPGKVALLNNNDELVGVDYTDPRDVTFTTFPIDQELRNTFKFRQILAMDDSVIWMVHDKGVTRFGARGKFHTFLNADGLHGQEYYLLRSHGDGIPVVISNDALNFLDLDEFKMPSHGPEVFLESISILNRKINIDETDSVHGLKLDKSLDLTKSLVLDYGHKEFTVEYSAIQFYAPDAARYRYRLTGFNESWIADVKDTKVSYTNLDPGDYTFEVQASIVPGQWGPVKKLPIRINPPFWKTWWFLAGVILMAGGLLYYLHYYRLQKALAVANLRNQIAQDLHDDIGSSLTKISLYSSLLGEEEHAKGSNGIANNIGELSREVIGQMSDIVWSVDQKNDTAGNLIARMRQFAAETLEACKIELQFEVQNIQDHAFIDPLFRQNFYLIFKEAVNNVCKHSNASEAKVVVGQINGRYFLKVYDNGLGIDKHSLPDGTDRVVQTKGGNGLGNMRRRAERIHMNFVVRSEKGGGTTIEIV